MGAGGDTGVAGGTLEGDRGALGVTGGGTGVAGRCHWGCRAAPVLADRTRARGARGRCAEGSRRPLAGGKVSGAGGRQPRLTEAGAEGDGGPGEHPGRQLQSSCSFSSEASRLPAL